MANKRKSMKGKGAEIFLGSDDNNERTDSEISGEKIENKEERKNSRISEKKNGRKEKAGFYLSEGIIDELELTWVKIRSLTGNKVSKSDIVSVALKELIEDFKENQEESELIKELSSQ